MMQSVAKHLKSAIDCLCDEWTETNSDIGYWHKGTLEEVNRKIEKLKSFEKKAQVVLAAARALENASGERVEDLAILAQAIADIEGSLLHDLLINIEMLEAFAEFKSRTPKPIYDADNDIPF